MARTKYRTTYCASPRDTPPIGGVAEIGVLPTSFQDALHLLHSFSK